MAAIKNAWNDEPYDPFADLIGYDEREQTLEEAYRAFCSIRVEE